MDHRVVSPIEMFSVARNNIHFYKTVVFYLRMQTSLSDWKFRIEKSLRLTIESQPRLRLQVDLSRKQAYFIILPMSIFEDLPIQYIERTNNDDEEEDFLDKIIENECNNGFEYNKNSPLWRLIVILSSESEIVDIIFTLNHVIGDGISGMAFFTSFIEYLSEKSVESFSLDNDPPSYELIPSKLPPLSSFLFQIIEKLLLPNILSAYFFPKKYWTGNIQLSGNEIFQTRLISFKLSDTILEALHKKCRNEKTTIHSALLSAILLSITEIFGKRNLEFRCSNAVNIRRFCQPIISNEQMGVFISAVDTYHYIPYRENLIDLFWLLAREIKEQINRELQQSALPLIQSLKFVSNWTKFLEDQRKTLPNGYSSSVDISNILQWSCQSNNPQWKILHGGFTQSANIAGSAFAISVVTVNGILKVYISFQEHSFQNMEEIKTFTNKVKTFLINVI